MTVGELLRRIDSRELTEWMAYYQLQSARPDAGQVPECLDDPETQSQRLKAALFKEK